MSRSCSTCCGGGECHKCMNISKQYDDTSSLDISFSEVEYALFICNTGINIDTKLDLYYTRQSTLDAMNNYVITSSVVRNLASYVPIITVTEQANKKQGMWIATSNVTNMIVNSIKNNDPQFIYNSNPLNKNGYQYKIFDKYLLTLINPPINIRPDIKDLFWAENFTFYGERTPLSSFPLKTTIAYERLVYPSEQINPNLILNDPYYAPWYQSNEGGGYYTAGPGCPIYVNYGFSPNYSQFNDYAPFYIALFKVSKNRVCFLGDGLSFAHFGLNKSSTFTEGIWYNSGYRQSGVDCPTEPPKSGFNISFENINFYQSGTALSTNTINSLIKNTSSNKLCCCPNTKFKQILFQFDNFASIFQATKCELTAPDQTTCCDGSLPSEFSGAYLGAASANSPPYLYNPYNLPFNSGYVIPPYNGQNHWRNQLKANFLNINGTIVVPVTQNRPTPNNNNTYSYYDINGKLYETSAINEVTGYYIKDSIISPDPNPKELDSDLWNCTFTQDPYGYRFFIIKTSLDFNDYSSLVTINNSNCKIIWGLPVPPARTLLRFIAGDWYGWNSQNICSNNKSITLPGINELGKLLCYQNPLTIIVDQEHEFLGSHMCYSYYTGVNPFRSEGYYVIKCNDQLAQSAYYVFKVPTLYDYYSNQKSPPATITITGTV